MVPVVINDSLSAFIKKHTYNGWFIDVNGNYCGIVGKYLFTIFINLITQELEFTVAETTSYDGDPIEWITLSELADVEINSLIKDFYSKYSKRS